MFMPSVSVAMGPIAHTIPPEFWEDRRKLFGLDTERFGAMGPHLKSQFEYSLARADDALSDGRAFFGGDDAGYADFAFYMNLWFQKRFGPAPDVLKPFANLDRWSARVKAIGHGERIEMEASEALAIAKAATPIVTPEIDAASGFSAGQSVTVRTEDLGADAVAGTLIRLTHRDIAILRDDPAVGQVAVHFPRLGQIVTPA
jgi:Glutathione S-transferase, C-terminal domain